MSAAAERVDILRAINTTAPTDLPPGRRLSINAHATRLDRAAPPRDFLRNESRKMFRTSSLGRNDVLANAFETLAYRRCIQCLIDRLSETPHNGNRSASRKEQTPCQEFTSKLSPCSLAVGTFGNEALR